MLSFKAFSNFLDACKGLRAASGAAHTAAGAGEMLYILDTAVYKPEHFKVHEVLDPATFTTYGDKGLWFMDARILWTFDALREYFDKPIIINNYIFAKDGAPVYKESGLRLVPVGAASRSQHLYGRAGDLKVQDITAEDARKEIMARWRVEPAFRFITAIELDVSWLHIDCRNTNQSTLLTFTKE